MKNLVLPLLLLLNSFLFVAQDKNEWQALAKKTVSYKADKDVINLLGNKRNLKKIKIKCNQGSIKLKKIIFYYDASEKTEHKPKGSGILSKGMSSVPIKVTKKKPVKKVEIQYEAYGNILLTKIAKVEVLGLINND